MILFYWIIHLQILDHSIPQKIVVEIYELNYKKGKSIAIGLYSDDIISDGYFDRCFHSLLVKYAFYRI